MYDRAPRNFTFQSSVGTGYNLGPGAYQHGGTISLKPEGYAPFQSLAGRDFTFTTDDAAIFPSPSQYEVKLLKDKIQGGTSINNKDSRFKALLNENPGPGNYCIEDPIKCISSPANLKRIVMESNKKLLYQRSEVPPSIPHAKTAYGYEEGSHGQLIRQKPPQIDNTLGPAFYDPKMPGTPLTNKYRGCFWSYDKAKRSNFAGSKGPGPSDYKPFSDYWSDVVERGERDSGKPPTELNRFVDTLQKKAIKDHIPGPAAYNHPGTIECPKAIYNETGEKIEHPPFGMQAKRFGRKFDDIPGPGSYNDPRTALNTLNKLTGLKRSPFGQTACRFNMRIDKDIPGPQQYKLDDAPLLKPSYIAATRKGGFGSTSIRNPDLATKTAHDIPGPSHYQPKVDENEPKFQQPLSSMFASLTNRDYDPVVVAKTDLPNGLEYNVVESFQLSQGPRHYAQPRTKDAKRRHTSFLSYADRYSKGSPLDAADKNIPGPGTYDSKSYLDNRKGKFYFRDRRFRDKHEETPGPGHYELSSEVLNSVMKKTFNASLGGPYPDTISEVDEVLAPTRQSIVAAI